MISLSRLHSNGHSSGYNASNVTPVTFKDGFFRFKVDNQQFVISFWTPVNQVAEVIKLVESTQVPNTAGQELDTKSLAASSTTVKVVDMNQEEVPPSGTEPTALGTVLSDSGTIVVSQEGGLDGNREPVQLKLDGIVDDLKKWMLKNSPPKPFEVQVRDTDLVLDPIVDPVLNPILNSVPDPILNSVPDPVLNSVPDPVPDPIHNQHICMSNQSNDLNVILLFL